MYLVQVVLPLRKAVLFALTICFGLAAYSNCLGEGAVEKDEKNKHVLQLKTKSVSVFKNGLGFFTREGIATKRDGWVMAEKIPAAKFGTLAIYSLNPKETVDVVGSGPGEVIEFDGIDVPKEARRERLSELLQATIELTYPDNQSVRKAAGKLLSLGPEFAILENGAQIAAVPIDRVTRLQVLGMPLRIHLAADKDEPDSKSGDAEVGVAYLSQGITWIPEYTVKIIDEDTAELTLRGTLVNEAEDLVHCDVNFVVGVPHFEHSNFLAPIAVGQTIRSIATSVAPAGIQSQIMSRAAIVSNVARADQFSQQPETQVTNGAMDGPGDVNSALNNLPQLSGPGGNDFTVYKKEDLTVRRGEKAIVTLFKRKIRYSHVYRWNANERLKHLLRLKNDNESAWTTGPFLAISSGNPLSEDLLKYTPKNGNCEIPMTTAVNIAHSKSEVELDRDLKSFSPSRDRFWDLVTLKGELKLRNFEQVDAELIIEVPVSGKPIKCSDEGQISVDSTRLKLLERTGKVQWRLTLKPGESKTLSYTYERYVPNQ